jgi:hypothetical protein
VDAATLQALGTVIAACGGGAVLLAIVNGLFKLASGFTHRERVRNTNLELQRVKAVEERDTQVAAAQADRDKKVDEANAERDTADKLRRQAEEHVAILKYQIRGLGAIPLEREDTKQTK